MTREELAAEILEWWETVKDQECYEGYRLFASEGATSSYGLAGSHLSEPKFVEHAELILEEGLK